MLLADLLARLESNRPRPVPVTVPGLGLLHVLPLTVGDVDEVTAVVSGETEKRGIARGLARSLCDETGKRYDVTPELLDLLTAQTWASLKPLTDAAQQTLPNPSPPAESSPTN